MKVERTRKNKRTEKSAAVLSFLLLSAAVFLFFNFSVVNGLFSSGTAVYAEDEKEESPCPECPECPDPTKVVLKGLKEKKEKLAREEERIDREKKQLEELMEGIDVKLEKLQRLKKQIAADFDTLTEKKTEQEKQKDAQFEEKLQKLVKMYAGMKPKNAAKIVNSMDIEVARQIFSRMRETSAATILANVESKKAAKISERIAYRKE
ncbi:MAG TPA: hypothetical protein VJ936_05595 [Desulfobacteraceae bacterium]|nr:hypothetical protein [Desulfobacteraceae bacterium]